MGSRWFLPLLSFGLAAQGVNVVRAGEDRFPTFRGHLVDRVPGGYQVAVADINRDGRPDLIEVSETQPLIAWYENPTWKRHTITTALKGNIDLALLDIDRDGRLDLVIASDFSLQENRKGGTLSWLRGPAEATGEWSCFRIGAEPTSHRVRWADIDGDGVKELVNVPIVGPGAGPPGWDVPARLQWYRIPGDPKEVPWEAIPIDETLHVVHGVHVIDFDGDGREEFLTASFEGVHLFDAVKAEGGIRWRRIHLGEGEQKKAPNRGASEVCVGKFASGRRFIATIEPWHGEKVVVYHPPEGEGLWRRHVIDTGYKEGHALACADLDGDGSDEIVAGYRGEGWSLYAYDPLGDGTQWRRHTIDAGGMSATGVACADLNGDGRLDIVAVGMRSSTLKWYENLGR